MVTQALVDSGLESSNLIVAIDFTKSNEWTGKKSFNGKNLHNLGDVLNPYEMCSDFIQIIVRAMDLRRCLSCLAAENVDGSKVLYFEQAFWRTPHKPFRQRFFMVKPCSKEMKCDVELSTYAIRDAEEYRNFCDRSKEQRPQPDEVIGDIAEHLTTIHLKRCERGKRCLYEGSTPGDGFPNTWNGASYCTSELAVLKNNEIHKWDKGYDEDGNQVWGVKGGPYTFKPAPSSSFSDPFAPLSFPKFSEKKIEGSFVLQE